MSVIVDFNYDDRFFSYISKEICWMDTYTFFKQIKYIIYVKYDILITSFNESSLHVYSGMLMNIEQGYSLTRRNYIIKFD